LRTVLLVTLLSLTVVAVNQTDDKTSATTSVTSAHSNRISE
jgi:hypothetical protein